MISFVIPISKKSSSMIKAPKIHKKAEVYWQAKNSPSIISIIEASFTRMFGSFCTGNVFNSQSVVMFSYLCIL